MSSWLLALLASSQVPYELLALVCTSMYRFLLSNWAAIVYILSTKGFPVLLSISYHDDVVFCCSLNLIRLSDPDFCF